MNECSAFGARFTKQHTTSSLTFAISCGTKPLLVVDGNIGSNNLGASAMPISHPVSHHDPVSLVQTWTLEIESGFNGYCALAPNALARVQQVLDALSPSASPRRSDDDALRKENLLRPIYTYHCRAIKHSSGGSSADKREKKQRRARRPKAAEKKRAAALSILVALLVYILFYT